MARLTPFVVALLLSPGAALLAFSPAAIADSTYYDVEIITFDGVRIAATVFVPAGAAQNSTPFVLMTHGWAGERTTEPTGRVADLLDAGYGVLTWDSRGFGASGGEVQLNSPDYEVKDVQRLVTYVARSIPSALKESRDDPVIGMSGGSYAGGIQLLAAAFDDRIDVIAPEITWNDLVQSLGPNGVPKAYWTTLLFGAGLEASCLNARNGDPTGAVISAIKPVTHATTGCQTSELARYLALVQATNSIPDEVRDAFLYRSPATYMSEIDIPTLLIQGFPDTLFDVNQAVANYEGIVANGAPAKLWIYDGGHSHVEGPALPNTQGALISPTVINWFDRHLKGDVLVDTGAPVNAYVAGEWVTGSAWPLDASTENSAMLGGMPALAQGPLGGGGPTVFTWTLMQGPARLAGTAHLGLNMTGQGLEGFLFAGFSVVDAAGVSKRVDGQVQPIRTAISPDASVRVETDLVAVQADIPVNSTLVLNFATTDQFYNANRVPGYINVNNLALTWNTV